MKMNSNARYDLQSTFKGPTHRLRGAVLAICALLCLPTAYAQLYTGKKGLNLARPVIPAGDM
jgi:hypothetical protein